MFKDLSKLWGCRLYHGQDPSMSKAYIMLGRSNGKTDASKVTILNIDGKTRRCSSDDGSKHSNNPHDDIEILKIRGIVVPTQ